MLIKQNGIQQIRKTSLPKDPITIYILTLSYFLQKRAILEERTTSPVPLQNFLDHKHGKKVMPMAEYFKQKYQRTLLSV